MAGTGPQPTAVDTWVLLVTILGIYWLVEGIMDIVSMSAPRSCCPIALIYSAFKQRAEEAPV